MAIGAGYCAAQYLIENPGMKNEILYKIILFTNDQQLLIVLASISKSIQQFKLN